MNKQCQSLCIVLAVTLLGVLALSACQAAVEQPTEPPQEEDPPTEPPPEPTAEPTEEPVEEPTEEPDDAAVDLGDVRAATEEFDSTETAQAAGYDLVEGLDHCFNNPGVGAMGFHYINVELLEDLAVEATQPEAIVYAPDVEGELELAAVEYLVPAEPWDAESSGELPSVLGQDLHLNEELGVYVLHAWIWQDNPTGVYEDWNPEVSCPEA